MLHIKDMDMTRSPKQQPNVSHISYRDGIKCYLLFSGNCILFINFNKILFPFVCSFSHFGSSPFCVLLHLMQNLPIGIYGTNISGSKDKKKRQAK